MRFQDRKVYEQQHFSIGFDTLSKTYYLSIPVSNGLVDYEEYYVIPQYWAEDSDRYLAELEAFAQRCRAHQVDDLLIQKPGSNRGTPV